MIKSIRKLNFLKRENAQTMVEFALVFPIVLLITYGIIEFGRMVFIYAAVTGSAREGARYGAAGGNYTSRYYMDCTGILDAVQRGALLLPIDNHDVSIWYDRGPNTNHIKNSCPPMDANEMDLINMGDRIVVHVVAHYDPMIAFLGFKGFDIVSENARTILVNVDVVGYLLPTCADQHLHSHTRTFADQDTQLHSHTNPITHTDNPYAHTDRYTYAGRPNRYPGDAHAHTYPGLRCERWRLRVPRQLLPLDTDQPEHELDPP